MCVIYFGTILGISSEELPGAETLLISVGNSFSESHCFRNLPGVVKGSEIVIK